VWIERLDIRGFRGLAGEFSFSSTLTLVIGENEAGKSTLHEALIRALYGFSRVERRRARGSSLLERRAPWDGGPYGLMAQLRNGVGTYRVEWDFASHDVRLVDQLGNDLSDEVARGRDDVELGERFLGMGIDDFRQVCCIDQDELAAVRNSPSLGVALQEAVATAGGGVPVEHAVERLNECLRSIGARTDNLRPSPAGRLNALERDRTRLGDQLREAEETREEIERLARDAASAGEELRALEAQRERTRQRLLRVEARELEQRQAEARRLELQSHARPDEFTPLPTETVEEVRLAQARRQELDDELASATRAAEVAQGSVEALETSQRELKGVLDGLELYADVNTSARDDVRARWSQLEQLTVDASEVDARLTEATVGRPREPIPDLEPELVEEIRIARARTEELSDERSSAESAAAAAAPQVEAIERRQRALQTGVDGLNAYADVDATARHQVRESWAQLEALTAANAPAQSEPFEPDPDLAAYRADRADLVALTTSHDEPDRNRRWLWIAVYVLSLGIAWLIRKLVKQRRQAQTGARLNDRLTRYGAASLEELDGRVVEEDRQRLRAEAAAEALRRAQAEAEERRRALAERLETMLDRVGARPAELAQRVPSYLAAVERHEQLREKRADLAHVEQELEQAREPLREQRRVVQEYERGVRRLRDAYDAAGIQTQDLDEAAAAFERLVAEVERRRREEQQARADVEALQRTQAEAGERRQKLTAQLAAALDQVGARPAADLAERVHAYHTAVEHHERLRQRQAELARVERELERARQPLHEQRRLTQEHERTTRRLREAYTALGIDDHDLDAAAEKLERLVLETEHMRKQAQNADAAVEALRSLLADETLRSLEERAAEARRLFDEHLRDHGELAPGHGGTRERLAAELTTLDENVREKVGQARGLDARVAQREEQAMDPASLKEQIAAIETQLERLHEAKYAVALARTVLQEAAEELRREFAPHLNEALERNLARVTGGRYVRAFVDGELQVQVEIGDGGRLQPADELSRATKDQLFLIERLEIARLLGPTKGAAPLLLDDPFARYDETRLRHALEVIAESARERQVILFSEDRALIDHALEVSPECAVIELPGPAL
jgi:DNA repair exonuclease SbcCD ATPase subunit